MRTELLKWLNFCKHDWQPVEIREEKLPLSWRLFGIPKEIKEAVKKQLSSDGKFWITIWVCKKCGMAFGTKRGKSPSNCGAEMYFLEPRNGCERSD